ncbi:flagellin [Desulfuromonas acetoxidans]
MTDATFQVGANAGVSQTISFSIDSAETSKLSAVGTMIEAPNGDAVVGSDVDGTALAAGDLVVNGTDVGATDGTNSSLADAINTAAGETIATATNVQTLDFSTVNLDSTDVAVGAGEAYTDGTDAAVAAVGSAFSVDTNAADATSGSQVITISDAQAANITAMDLTVDGSAVDTTGLNYAGITTAATLASELDGLAEISATVSGQDVTITSATTGATSTVSLASVTGTDGSESIAAATDGTAAQASVATITVTDADAANVDGTTLEFNGAAIDLTGVDFGTVTDGATLAAALQNSSDIASASWAGDTLTLTSAATVTGQDFSVASGSGLTDANGTPAVASTMDITIDDAGAATVTALDLTVEGVAVDDSSIDYSSISDVAGLVSALDGLSEISAADNGDGTITISSATAGTAGTLAAGTVVGDATSGALVQEDASVSGTYTMDVDGTSVDIAAAAGGEVTAQEVVDAINDNTTGFTAALNDDGQVQITKDDGSSFTLAESVDIDGDTTLDAASVGLDGIDDGGTTYNGQVSLDSTNDISVEEVTSGALASAGLDTAGNATTTIDQVDISTREGATTAISSVDAALAQIDTIRGDLGAVQNRFESTIANLQNVSENLSAARSRILDADIAEETSNMTKQNILQQAGVSILAQANQAPQLALSLLG